MVETVLLLIGLVVGIVIGYLLARVFRSNGPTQSAALAANALEAQATRFATVAEARLRESQAASAADLAARQRSVDDLVRPLTATLQRFEQEVRGLAQTQHTTTARLAQQMEQVGHISEAVRAETATLAGALGKPQTRGRWGELQLERLAELAGMSEHIDFDTQVSMPSGDGALQRPDMIVHLPGGGEVVVDSKVSLAAFLQAVETTDPAIAADRLTAHARHLREHMTALAGKRYWQSLPVSPEFVVMFVPGEAFLGPALERDPDLLADAIDRRVVIATPMTFTALLRTVAMAWKQQSVTDHATEILAAGREMLERFGILAGHLDTLGRTLDRSVEAYNKAVGSMENRLMPSARRLSRLDLGPEPASATPVEARARPISSGGFAPGADGPDESAQDLNGS